MRFIEQYRAYHKVLDASRVDTPTVANEKERFVATHKHRTKDDYARAEDYARRVLNTSLKKISLRHRCKIAIRGIYQLYL